MAGLNSQAETSNDLFSQIQDLQEKHKIQVIGLERIQNGDKILTSGNLEQEVRQIFAPYNHIVSRNKQGQIERIVIVNKKQKRKDHQVVLPTSRQGNHFIVPVLVSGNGSVWQSLDMVIDTGADLVVLPESMIESLGMRDSPFTSARMQTANGFADAKIGLLQEVKIAGETIEKVEVAFIPDHLLGTNKLLGMSVLGRYQVNIDDKNRVMTLTKKY